MSNGGWRISHYRHALYTLTPDPSDNNSYYKILNKKIFKHKAFPVRSVLM